MIAATAATAAVRLRSRLAGGSGVGAGTGRGETTPFPYVHVPPERTSDSMARQTDGAWSQLGRYGGHGLTIAVATGLFAWLGTLADDRLHTEPLFVLLGAFLGFGAGFYAMYSDLVLRPRSRDASGDGTGGDGPPGGHG